jgi:signal transduction histidine kinase
VAAGEAAVNAERDAEDPVRALIHEFRNLLAVIVNYSELIADETDNPEAIRADIQEVRTAAERAIMLTEQFPRPARDGSA